MDLYSEISRRMSCRTITGEPLSQAQLQEIDEAIEGFDTLYPNIALTHRVVSETKGAFGVKAPHYLIVSGEGKPGEQESAGFLFEQLVLWLSAKGLGCVWQGGAKDANAPEKNDIIVLAFGTPMAPPYRELSGFRRKPIEEITNAPDDECIQAVHLAPSGMNTQPWFVEKGPDEVLFYKRKLTGPMSLVYKMSDVDMGIALCHYMIACKHFGKPFAFTAARDMPKERLAGYPSKKGHSLFGVVAAESAQA